MNIYQIKISLDGVKPSIYRIVLVKPKTSFYEFHHIIQIAMGWENYHLYQFETGDFYITEPDEFMEGDSIDPNDILLNEVLKKKGDKVKYEYDFGDGWRHTILLEKIVPLQLNTEYPTCIRGKRNGPPEDCGGIWGYEDLKEALANKKHPEHKEMLEWLGDEFDPDYFDIGFVNEMFKDFDLYLEDELENFEDEEGAYFDEDDFGNYFEDDEEDSAEVFQKHIFHIINEQMDENDPPETAATFKRLLNADFSHLDAKLLIAKCASYELISIVTDGKPYSMDRYIKNLKKLPNIDFDDFTPFK